MRYKMLGSSRWHLPRHLQATVDAIVAERARQVEAEGWTAEHDAGYVDVELMRAARCYYANAVGLLPGGSNDPPAGWPWDARWWKPKGARRDLERAGALLMAEKERLHRRVGDALQLTLCNIWLGLVIAALAPLVTPGEGPKCGP